MNILNTLALIFLFGWYPVAWLALLGLTMFSSGEEVLEHDVATDRAIVSNNLSLFLMGTRWRIVGVATLYLLGMVLILANPLASSLYVSFILFAAKQMDYGQIID